MQMHVKLGSVRLRIEKVGKSCRSITTRLPSITFIAVFVFVIVRGAERKVKGRRLFCSYVKNLLTYDFA
jgi:hypothetical protein